MQSATQQYPPLLAKALTLLTNHELRRIAEDVYLVRAETDRVFMDYMVEKITTDTFSCTCQGYKTRGRCSHSLAVFLLEERRNEKKCHR